MRHLIGFAVGAILWSGCSQGSFLERRFDNFTAHYNAYYNASRTFKSQEKLLRKREQSIDLDHYVQVYTLPEGGGRSAEFEKVITKCADLLRKHPRSKWVDDALLLIGKSYYYQSNYVGAELKFGEVVDLGGPLTDEARFWLARTLVASESFEAASDLIDQVLSGEDLRPRWRGRYFLLKGDLHARAGEWDQAAEALEQGLQGKTGGELAGRASFLLGQVYETLGRHEEAERAYTTVRRYKPRYELEYAALYSRAAVLGLKLDPQVGLEAIRRMMRDDKHFSKMEQLELLRAQILQTGGVIDDAIDLYADMLYPPEGIRPTSLRGEAHYRLAELYRDGLADFYLASVHFDTASTILHRPQSSQELYTPHAIVDARELSTVFATYRDVKEQIAEYDSLLFLGSLDDAAFDSALTDLRVRLAEESARQQEELERRRAEQRFRNPGAAVTEDRRSNQTRGGIQGSRTSGFLNHRDIQQVQEGFLSFREIWGNRPLVQNWRRSEAVRGSTAEAAESGEGPANGESDASGDPMMILPPVDVSSVPRDSTSRAQMKDDRAEARYQLANIMFLLMGRPDSAAYWYRMVVTEDEARPVAQRAIYAMAEVQQAMGDTVAANRLYEQIIQQYPATDFAGRARERLNIPPVEEAKDSLEIASDLYNSAYGRWNAGEHGVALESMLRTAADYPTTEVAPKALLASGLIFMEWARLDSLDVEDVIPLREDLFSPEEHAAALEAAGPPESDSTIVADSTLAADSTLLPTPTEVTPAPEAAAPMESDSTIEADMTIAADSTFVTDSTLLPDSTEVTPAPEAAEVDLGTADILTAPERFVELSTQDEDSLLDRRSAIDATAIDTLVDQPARDMAAIRDEEVGSELVRQDSTFVSEGDSLMRAVPDPSVGDSLQAVATLEETPQPVEPEVPEEPQGPPDPDYYLAGIIPFPATLSSLFESIETNYPSSPYAARAKELRQAVADYHEEKRKYADSVRTAIQDSIATALAADSLAQVRVADSLAALQDSLISSPKDSLHSAVDSAMTAVDSTRLSQPELHADSLESLRDTLIAPVDSLESPPVGDSTRVSEPDDLPGAFEPIVDEGPPGSAIDEEEVEEPDTPPVRLREEDEGIAPDSTKTPPGRLIE